MLFTFWNDDISRKLEKSDKSAALFWRLSNLFGKLCMFPLAAGVVCLLIAALGPPILSSMFGELTADLNMPVAKNISSISENTRDIFSTLGLLAFIIAGLLIIPYSVATGMLALRMKDNGWGIALLLGFFLWPLAILGPIYKQRKRKEFSNKTEAVECSGKTTSRKS